MLRRFLAIGCACSLVLLSACTKDEPEPVSSPLRVNATVAAVVNDEPILASEVELEAAAQGLMEAGDTLTTDNPVFSQILEQLIDQKLLAQEALNRGLDQEEGARHRLQVARERILGNILVESLVSAEVDEAAIQKMYEAQTALQQLGEEVLIRLIVVNRENEADELYEELRKGAEFAQLAFGHSVDRNTNAEGGLVGYVLPEEMSESYTVVINKTPVGGISKPFQSDVGWNILKVEDRRQEEPATFDETRPKIVQYLTLTEISKAIKSLRTRAEIQTITGSDPDGVFPVDAPDLTDSDLLDDSDEDEEMVTDEDKAAVAPESVPAESETNVTPEQDE